MKLTEQKLRKIVREHIKDVLNEQKQHRIRFTRGYMTVGDAGSDVKYREGGDVIARVTASDNVMYLNQDDVTQLIDALRDVDNRN